LHKFRTLTPNPSPDGRGETSTTTTEEPPMLKMTHLSKVYRTEVVET
jgi:hypothetical protein